VLSAKQQSFLAHSDAFLSIADGAVRSGKTHSALHRLSELAITGPPGDFIISGKTERTVKRNVVQPLMEMHSKKAVRFVQGSGELHLFGRRMWLVGANDIRAEEKVRGLTAAGGYMNEVTLHPKDMVAQIIDRLSVPGAQLLGDTNPDSPYHWLYTDYLNADPPLPKRDLKRWRFRLDDNPVLDEEYKERLNRMHAPGSLWHRRMVEGEWVIAEGAIYDMFDPSAHVVSWTDVWGRPEVPPFEKVLVGVDYGTANATVFLVVGKRGNRWYVASEWRWDSRKRQRQMTDREYAVELIRFLEAGGVTPAAIEIDPSAASFKAELRAQGVRKVYDADNEVLDGIRRVAQGLTTGTLYIHESCEGLIAEMANYRWDEKAQERGEDKPVKDADHGPDALRYAVARILGPQPRRALRVVR
jgi:PBSX family phage terminase large subunit